MARPRRQDDKGYARGRTGTRIAQGELYKQPCEICGATPAEAHHIDYAQPDRVMWLCKPHHAQVGSQFGRPAPADWMADIRAAQARIDAIRLAARSLREIQEADEGPWPLRGS